MTRPSRSHQITLRRSPRLLRKTNRWPANGSPWPRKSRTSASKPSKLRRVSAGFVATNTRVEGGSVSLAGPPTPTDAASPARRRAGCDRSRSESARDVLRPGECRWPPDTARRCGIRATETGGAQIPSRGKYRRASKLRILKCDPRSRTILSRKPTRQSRAVRC